MGAIVKRAWGSLAVSVFIAVMVPVAWCMMLFSNSAIALTAMGLYSLKFFTVLSNLLFGIVYCANILINGVGQAPYTNDWYGFTMWGVQFMPVVFLVMLLATWLFAIAIRVGNVIVRKRMQP